MFPVMAELHTFWFKPSQPSSDSLLQEWLLLCAPAIFMLWQVELSAVETFYSHPGGGGYNKSKLLPNNNCD